MEVFPEAPWFACSETSSTIARTLFGGATRRVRCGVLRSRRGSRKRRDCAANTGARPPGYPVRPHGRPAARAGRIPRLPPGSLRPGEDSGALRAGGGPARSGWPRLLCSSQVCRRRALGDALRRIPVTRPSARCRRRRRTSRSRAAQRTMAPARVRRSTLHSRPIRLRPRTERTRPPEGAVVTSGQLRAPWRWERLLVEAAVIGGSGRWRRRIQGLGNELRLELADLSEDDRPRAAAWNGRSKTSPPSPDMRCR